MRSQQTKLSILFLAVILLALASPVIKWLIREGGRIGIAEGEQISFCNVLFVGNLCAGLSALVAFGTGKILRDIRSLPKRVYGLVFVNLAFALAIPTLLFIALEQTTVTNLILLGRLESVSFALVASVFLGSQLTRSQISGYMVIFLGIGVVVAIEGMGMLGRGEFMVISAAILQGVAAVTGRRLLDHISPAAFVALRNFTSAVVFFGLAVWLHGLSHFAEAFAPGLWAAMLIYGLGIVALGQWAWYHSLKTQEPSTVASVSMLNPLFAVSFAFLLLGEVPTTAQIIGGVFIGAGMILTRKRAPKPHLRPGLTSTLSGA